MKYLILIFTILYTTSFLGQSEGKKRESAAPKSESEKSGLDQSEQNQFKATEYKALYIETRNRSINKYSKEISREEQTELDGIIVDLEKTAPESYEFHYTAYLNSNNDPNAFFHLQKAYEIYPNNVELYDDFIAHYELTNNLQGKKQFCDKLYRSNTIPQGVMDYNYNVLMSLEQNAILFTNGWDDTYPLWIWQEIKSIRRDVTILNLDLVQHLNYQKDKLKELNIYPITSSEPVDIVKEVVKNNPNRPINIGLTVNPIALKDLKKNLYLTGLVLKYSKSSFDNMDFVQNRYEYKFNKDFATQKVTNSKVKKLNNNYILPLAALMKYYEQSGAISEAEKLKKIILKLANEGGKLKAVEQYLEQ